VENQSCFLGKVIKKISESFALEENREAKSLIKRFSPVPFSIFCLEESL